MSPSSFPNDLLIRVALVRSDVDCDTELSPSVWRRFRVSSAVNLDLLHDKILAPIMGWTRNYHTYYFCKIKNGDGIVYLQEDTQAVDLMHYSNHVQGRTVERPETAAIGDLLQNPGDTCLYTYDLGDAWYHLLTLEKVMVTSSDADFHAATSAGCALLLDGAMRCPNENGNGCETYQSEVLDLVLRLDDDPDDDDAARELARVCFEEKRNDMNVMGPFRPTEFDLAKHRLALRDALSSRNSARNSVKMFGGAMSMMFGAGASKILSMARMGQKSVLRRSEGEHGNQSTMISFKETFNVKPDPRDATLCCNCGCPFGRDADTGRVSAAQPLRACGKCHIPHYCSRECQLEHWKSTHKAQCKSFKKEYATHQNELATNTPNPNRFDVPGEDMMLQRYDPQNLRFKPNDCVECMVGENEWALGYIVQTFYKESEDGPISAYQIIIPDALKRGEDVLPFIHAPWDDDYQVRAIPSKDPFPTEEAKKKWLGTMRYEYTPFLASVRSAESRGMEDEYNIWPSEKAAKKVHRRLAAKKQMVLVD